MRDVDHVQTGDVLAAVILVFVTRVGVRQSLPRLILVLDSRLRLSVAPNTNRENEVSGKKGGEAMAGVEAGLSETHTVEVTLAHCDNPDDQVTVVIKLPRDCTRGQLVVIAIRALRYQGYWDHRNYVSHREV